MIQTRHEFSYVTDKCDDRKFIPPQHFLLSTTGMSVFTSVRFLFSILSLCNLLLQFSVFNAEASICHPMMDIKKVAMIGAGSMGGGMALLLAENGVSVSIQDPSEETVDKLIQSGESQGIHGKLTKHEGKSVV